jgi:hypothetical protein
MLEQPFFQITLPLMVTFVATIWAGAWAQNKRLDEMSKRIDDRFNEVSRRFDELAARLARLEAWFVDHENRLTKLETGKWK